MFSDHKNNRDIVKTIESELTRHHSYICGEHYVVIRLCRWETRLLEAFNACPVAGSLEVGLEKVFESEGKRWA